MATKHLSFSSRLAFKPYDKALPVSTINSVKALSQKVLFGDFFTLTGGSKNKKTYPKSPPRPKK
jgi:hypothetical protein